MKGSQARILFQAASAKLSEILSEHREALARGEPCGAKLARMAENIRQRAEADPTAMRGETFEELTSAPSED